MSAAPLKVLLVEDNPGDAVLVRSSLEQSMQTSFELTVADRLDTALETLAADSLDLVLMDVHMPEMDGREATRQIRLHEKTTGNHVPIIGLTANSILDDERACLEAGMDDYVPKPIQMGILLPVVARVLGRQTDSTTSGFNVEAALIQGDGNEELLRRLAQLFFDNCPMYLTGIEAAITGDDAPALAAAAHDLKGALNMLALSEPMEAALELEEMG